jgi:superfamily II DNA helicase RecQ
MRSTAMSLLPKDRMLTDKLYNDLKRGVNVLDDEPHLNMYLNSYGKMHKAKLDEAFACIPDPATLFANDIEIYDWGCGQGTALICLLDYLIAHHIKPNIRIIYLIEPSVPAINRAKEILECYNLNVPILSICKTFDELAEGEFAITSLVKFHLFSNILDVDAFDLAQFIHLFQRTFKGENYFVCVGPYYYNNKRVDEFIAATSPDAMYATFDKERGTWKQEWTISLRVFFKDFKGVESIENIRKRIEDSHKKDQFFAGYILDAVEEEYKDTELEEETAPLFHSLSVFDVKSNKPIDCTQNCNPQLAVLANIISRGLPTKAPIAVEKIFAKVFGISDSPQEGSTIIFQSKHTISSEEIYEALHVIDPRFKEDFYNGDMLESSFEKEFVTKYLKHTDNSYLIQLLEPQRPLSTLVDFPNERFSKDQRVDFALDIPYAESGTGFIFELDGAPYHSNIFQRLRDERRDRISSAKGWDTYRIETLDDNSFLKGWEQETTITKYLSTIKKNSQKKLIGKWNDILQIVLSPLAIPRIERMIVQAILSGELDLCASKWDIIVVERDVPCSAIALDLFQEDFKQMAALSGSGDVLPNISLTIVSTKEFNESKLHLSKPIVSAIPRRHYDLCIDIAMLMRDNIDALPLNVDAETTYIIRSSHYQKRERTICSATSIKYPSFVTKDGTGLYIPIKEREDVLTYFLRNIFRKTSFRPGQLPILSRSLSGKTTIGLLPTGGGKSLTYQLSSLLQPGVTIVVDPLVSLMVDQVRGLRDIRIDSCDCVNSNMNALEKAQKLNLLQNGALQFILLSPERYMMENFRETLLSMSEKNHIYFAYGVIDEVHCVSEWGHDFRPSYLHLGRNMIHFMHTKSGQPLPIIGLTATASFDVLADVERELTLGGDLAIDSDAIVRPENDSRPELTYRIVNVESNYDKVKDANNPYMLSIGNDTALKNIVAESKRRKIYELLEEIPKELEIINTDDSQCHLDDFKVKEFYNPNEKAKYANAGIVFCPHAHGNFGVLDNENKTREGVATELMSQCNSFLKIGAFVGGGNPAAMKSFNQNDLNLMVATKAFGMGIDKPNIRFTINLNHPSSIESFVQEAGRAGRDRKHAISYILYEPTEYIQFTVDKINDIRLALIPSGIDPAWLDLYKNRIVLRSDFIAFCTEAKCDLETAQSILSVCVEKGYFENVDKNIDLWFHNNSFRGMYKEKVILTEMTYRIQNIRPTLLLTIQGMLSEEVGNTDILLKADINKNAIKIVSMDDNRKQYGYIFLDTLTPRFNFIDFELDVCRHISFALVRILSEYKEHSAYALMTPIDNSTDVEEGIYGAMQKADADGYIYVTVTWENMIQQDPETFERNIHQEISRIAKDHNWEDIDSMRYGDLKLSLINDFDSLIAQISKCSNDPNWLRYHAFDDIYSRLKRIFSEKRDKDDTDKAIYRMCCVGLVEDVTIDYLSETYQLKIRKRTDDEYKQYMLDFFRKYYSLEQAQKRVNDIDNHQGNNYLDKCLGYLTEFVYDNLEKKRYRAIEDMRIACEDSITQRTITHDDKWLKEFIHLYFNSKYARDGYEVDGEPYSLSYDTGSDGRDDFDIVLKYIDVISKDSSGSEIDNVKHLYGATLLCLRAKSDNAALLLLLTYCIAFLGAGTNEALKNEALNDYIDGFVGMYNLAGAVTWDYIDQFNNILDHKAKEDFIKEKLVNKGKETIMLLVHEDKFNKLANNYIN